MIAVALLLLAAPETIALRLEDAGGVPRFDARSLLEALAERIEAHSGARVVIDDGDQVCKSADRCVEEIKARAKAAEVVWLKMVKGPRRIHLEAWRGADFAEVNLSKDQSETKARLDELTGKLFPEALAAPEPPPEIDPVPPPPIAIAPVTPPPPEVSLPIVPIVLASAALITAGLGVGFGLSSKSAGDEIQAGPILSDPYRALRDREEGHAVIANVCWISAGALLGGAVISWWLEAP